jgi:phospholipid/cholesterol/gamma-HCH transport system substrate-binding protein
MFEHKKALTVVLVFTTACVAGFFLLWVKSGGGVVGVTQSNDYRLTFETEDVKNIRDLGDVSIAGVRVGQVESTELDGDKAKVTISINDDVAPLHNGATVRVGVKSLVGSSFVEVIDGKGSEIKNGSSLSSKSVIPAVDVDELLSTLDPKTRRALSGAVQSLAKATGGTQEQFDQVMTGLGRIGDGATALDALASQSDDLQELTRQATVLLTALDTGRGQIADLVRDAQRLTSASAGERKALEQTVQALPALVRSATTGAQSLEELSGPLAPIASDLRKAAPDLNAALLNLPATTNDLRGLLPSLNGTLDAAPATLSKVPTLANDAQALLPTLHTLLRDVDPMLSYMSPYGLDLGALFANFGASFDTLAEDGIRPIRLTATAEGLGSIKGLPVKLPPTPFFWKNPYPAPHTADQPTPFTGNYPKVEENDK